MHILISFCNGRIEGMPKLGLLDTATSQVEILRMPESLAASGGCTGLALADDAVYAVVQDAAQHLAIFDRVTFALRAAIPLTGLYDVHSLWPVGEYLYAVSTGTDEVVRLHLRGDAIVGQEVFWRPDPDGPREDRHHLNAILGVGASLYVSGFGRKAGERWSSARDGFVMDITARRPVVAPIEHPHSLIRFGESIAYCESRHSSVRVAGTDQGQRLPGYTRGMCVVGDAVYVGTSTGRRVSKSTGLVNNPGESGVPDGGCGIVRLSTRSFQIEEIIDLSDYGHEIYDLLPVADVAAWPVIPASEWQRDLRRRLLLATERQHAANMAEAPAQPLGDQRGVVEALERELTETRQATERRLAEAAATIAGLRGELAEATGSNVRLQAALAEANGMVEAMRGTKLWRAGRLFWRTRAAVGRRLRR